MKVLHCILLVLMFGFASVGMAQKLSFSQTSVAIYQGGDPAGIVITTTSGATVRIMETSKNLKAGLGNNIFGGIVLQIIATKNTPLGSGFVKLRAEYKKKFVSGTIQVKVLRPNDDPNIDLFTVDRGSAIEGESINFTVSVSDFNKDQMTCYLDVDGDGKTDYTQKSCSKWNQNHIYTKAGNFKPNLIVQDSYGGKVSSSNIELFKNETNKFIAIDSLGITVMVNTEKDTQDILAGDSKCIDENQKCSLRAAIMELNANKGIGTIKIPTGNYILTLDGEDDTAQRGDLDITGKVKILGEGPETTTIDANQIDRIFEVKKGGKLWISNLKITGGNTKDSGGAINANDISSYIEINNCNISNNKALQGYGGGILGNNFNIFKSNFSRNTAYYDGGAVFGNGRVENSSFTNNKVNNKGGAISAGNVEIIGSYIGQNEANLGGGIYFEGIGEILNSIVSKNHAEIGGGIYSRDASLLIDKTLVDSNEAVTGGGLINSGGKSIIHSSIFSGNIAKKDAGGIYSSSEISISYSNIVSNRATKAGGLYIQGEQDQSSFKAMLLAENVADDGPDCYGSIMSKGYNLVQSPKDCRFVAAHRDSAGKVTDHVAENPQLQSLVDSYFGTLITPSNPVLINAIPKADCTLPDGSPLETDMLGKPRFQGSGCDIGAIEVR